MSNKNYLHLLNFGFLAMLTTACGTKTFVVYSPGENLAALTKITESEDLCEHPFGGDGGKNLFFAVRDKRNISCNIYKKDNPLQASMNQKTAGNNKNVAPSYCEATDKLAFAGKQEGASFRDIVLMNASLGNALTEVTSTPDAEENYPCLSKDGKFIVYEKSSVYGRWMDTEIWIRSLQTGENTMLGIGRMPSFSPDGNRIAYIKYTSDGVNTCLWTMNKDASNQAQLTDAKMGEVSNPRFSPDGKQIVFQCRKRQKRDFDLYVIDDNGNNLTQLTLNKSFDGEPYWANDGNIYFTSDRGGKSGHYQIWRFSYGSLHAVQTVTDAPSTTTTIVAPQTVYHNVERGETISQIAQKYGVTVKDIVKWNNLPSMTLTQGMKLKVSAQ